MLETPSLVDQYCHGVLRGRTWASAPSRPSCRRGRRRRAPRSSTPRPASRYAAGARRCSAWNRTARPPAISPGAANSALLESARLLLRGSGITDLPGRHGLPGDLTAPERAGRGGRGRGPRDRAAGTAGRSRSPTPPGTVESFLANLAEAVHAAGRDRRRPSPASPGCRHGLALAPEPPGPGRCGAPPARWLADRPVGERLTDPVLLRHLLWIAVAPGCRSSCTRLGAGTAGRRPRCSPTSCGPRPGSAPTSCCCTATRTTGSAARRLPARLAARVLAVGRRPGRGRPRRDPGLPLRQDALLQRGAGLPELYVVGRAAVPGRLDRRSASGSRRAPGQRRTRSGSRAGRGGERAPGLPAAGRRLRRVGLRPSRRPRPRPVTGRPRGALAQRQQHPQDRDPHQAGAEHVQADQGLGQVREVLDVADDALAEQDQEQVAGAVAAGPAGRPPRAARTTGRRSAPTTIQAKSACSWATVSQSTAACGATSLESPGVRAGPVTDRAHRDQQRPRRRPAPSPAAAPACRPAAAAAASPSRARCQVTTATVISAVDSRKCAATMYGLRPVSTTMPPSTALPMTTQNCAQPSRVRLAPAGLLGARGDDRPADGRAQHVGQHAVAELDGAVDAHRAGRGQAVAGARGPGRAAQAGAGQPDRAAGDHDDHRHHQGGREPPGGPSGGRGPAGGDEGEGVARERLRRRPGSRSARAHRRRAACARFHEGSPSRSPRLPGAASLPAEEAGPPRPARRTAHTARIAQVAPRHRRRRAGARPAARRTAPRSAAARARPARRPGTCRAARSPRRRPAAAGRPGWPRPASPRPCSVPATSSPSPEKAAVPSSSSSTHRAAGRRAATSRARSAIAVEQHDLEHLDDQHRAASCRPAAPSAAAARRRAA